MNINYCSSCGAKVLENALFCSECGNKIIQNQEPKKTKTKQCPNCTYTSEEDEIYCPDCGNKLILGVKEKKATTQEPKPTRKEVSGSEIKATPEPVKKKKGGVLRTLGKVALWIFGIVILGIVGLYFIGDSVDNDNTQESVQQRIISSNFEELNADLSLSKAVVGNLDQNGIQLDIPSETFDQNVKLQVKEDATAPSFDNKRATLLGTPYKISIDQKSKRLNKPVTVTFKLSEQEISELEHPEDLWIGYYNGQQWDYFMPSEVNTKEKFVTFDTYHFSPYSKSKLTKEERIDDFADKLAVEQWSAKSNNVPARKATEKMVRQILGEKLGLSNKSMTQDIVESIMGESDYQKLLVSYNDNNMTKFSQELSLLTGKIIVKVVTEDSNAKALLGSVIKHASKINTGLNMARALSEGKLEQAAKDLSKEIIGTFPITKLFREAARITDKQIIRWRDQELEAAYKVYLNGAESSVPFWGYSVRAGDFQAVWIQMKGLKPQLLRDAKQKYALANGIDVDRLGKRALDIIEEETMRNLEAKFKRRGKEEKEIGKLKAENIKLIKIFENKKLLDRGYFGYVRQSSLEIRLHRLYKIKDMILRDTKCKVGFIGGAEDGIIHAKIIARLIQIWYDRDNGPQKYREELIKRGYIKKVEKIKPANELPKTDEKNKKSKTKIEKPFDLDGIDGIVDIDDENTKKDNTDSKTDYWVLTETLIEKKTYKKHQCYQGSLSLSNGSFSWSKEVITGACNNGKDEYSSLDANGSWSQPPDILAPGKEYPMNSSINRTSKLYDSFHFSAGIGIYMDYYSTGCGGSRRSRLDIAKSLKVQNRNGEASDSWSGTFKAPNFGYAESQETNKFQIKVTTTSGCVRYIYTWKK